MARKAKPGGKAASASRNGVRIRHYCQGIGDCHLLRFPRAEGGDFTMLIDCGVHPSVTGGAHRMRAIVDDIVEASGGRIDLLVVTHEHMDHVSGFLSAREGFERIEVGDVWFGWTENPADPQVAELDKFKADAAAALAITGSRLAAAHSDAALVGLRTALDAATGFYFGAKGERVRSARDAAKGRARGKVVYHEPGAGPLPLPGVAGVRVYVLGPPRDLRQLRLDYRASETYSAFGPGPLAARALKMAAGFGGDDGDAPFDPEIGLALGEVLPLAADPKGRVGNREPDASARRATLELLRDYYVGPGPGKDTGIADQSWRRIDYEQTAMSAELALQLDRMTNNCSLVLAFEFEDTGRVLLFPGDAQVGSWLSWHDLAWELGDRRVTGPDLLARTVYLKVAHHGSHNASLKAKGLELMIDPDLCAFVPVNAADAQKVGWREMPFAGILDALNLRAAQRVIRADDPWIASGEIPAEWAARRGSITLVGLGDAGLWLELDVA